MNPLAYLQSLGSRFIWRRKAEDELSEELRSHIQLRADHLEQSGLDRPTAQRQARIEFGSSEQFKEECREAVAGNFLDTLIQDIRFSFRLFRKYPSFSATVVLTMALGVGATTGIFSVVDATLLRPLPYPHPDQLVRIVDDLPGVGTHDVGLSEPEWQDLQHSRIFEYVSPTWYDDNNLTGCARPARVSLLIVAPDYFAVLGIKPQLGRTFPPDDHSPGFTQEVVIGDALWKGMFGGDPQILGKSIRMDTDLYQIVGVMPPNFRDPASVRGRNIEIWAATSFYGAPLLDHPLRNRRNLPTAIARLKPGLTVAAAQSQVDSLVASLQKQFASDYPAETEWRVRLVPLKESLVGNVRQPLVLLFVAVAAVLLIGCANIANLMLARAATRRREVAVRQALGAGTARIIRQLLTESLVLSMIGGAVGIAVLVVLQDFLARMVPNTLPRLNDFTISWPVFAFALSISVVAGLLFGLAPASTARRLNLTNAFKQGARNSTASGEQVRSRGLLVVTEFAISLALLICAGLLFHSFWDLANVQLGFAPENVMAIKTRLPYPNDARNDVYSSAANQAPFFREVLRRCRALPGVEQAAFGDLGALPLVHDRVNQDPPIEVIAEDRSWTVDNAPQVNESIVSPEYFQLTGMTLRRGRFFTELDDDKAEPVAIINEAMAKLYWPNENAVGKHIKLRRATSWTTVVGIVGNARTESLEDATIPEFFTTIYQRGAKHLAIFLRGKLDVASIPDQVREQVQSVDSTIPVFGAQTLTDTVSTALQQRRFAMEMVALFALTALLLAGLGIYGVISYATTERTHEIGIRLALGAQTTTILRMVLRQGVRLAIIGTAAGLIVAFISSRVMKGLLYGVSPGDTVVFVTVPLLLFGVAIISSYLPARRATRIDPIVALRAE